MSRGNRLQSRSNAHSKSGGIEPARVDPGCFEQKAAGHGTTEMFLPPA
ncbi:hypothetical protein [Desulfosporosinus sp. BICA1-9]|nr:hypothetical protein [Desulfosporosinus sp. BICA1-9]